MLICSPTSSPTGHQASQHPCRISSHPHSESGIAEKSRKSAHSPNRNSAFVSLYVGTPAPAIIVFVMKPLRLPRTLRKILRIILIAGGLWGGWLAASALNDHRADIPRRVAPATQPTLATPNR